MDPLLPLVEHTSTIGGRRLPGVVADTAPDLWGELLLRRQAAVLTVSNTPRPPSSDRASPPSVSQQVQAM